MNASRRRSYAYAQSSFAHPTERRSPMTKLLTVALLCAALSFEGTGSARALSEASQPDQVIQWNRTLLQILQTPGAQPATVHPTRSMAIMQLAVYDAVNAIEGGNAPYLGRRAPRARRPRPRRRRPRTRALLSLFPSQQSADRCEVSRTRCARSAAARTSARGSGSGRRPPTPSSPRARTTAQRPRLRVRAAVGPGRVSAHAAELPAARVHALGRRAAVRARAPLTSSARRLRRP